MRKNHQPAANASRRWIQPRVSWLLTFLGFTAFGILNFEYRYLDNLARGVHHTFALRLFEEMTGAYVGLLLFPFVVWAIRRARIRRDNWWVMVPFNFLAMCAFSVADTTGMSVVRRLLAPLFGLGQYDYGIMLYRYPMELAQHVLLFWFAVGAIYTFDSYREARDRQVASADLEARLAEAQLQNLQLQLQPHFLFNALNTISSVMYDDVRRADTMLARLSDLLRRTLQTGHSQEVPLEEELALVKSYIAIMEERFGDDLLVEFASGSSCRACPRPTIDSPAAGRKCNAPRAQSAGNKTCLMYRRNPGKQRTFASGAGQRTGDARSCRTTTRSKGIGLSNTGQRLRTLYGARQQMLLENADGLRVTIRLPLHTEAVSI